MTRILVAVVLAVAFSWPVFAVDDGDVLYVGGTVSNLKDGSLGKIDTKSRTELAFVSSTFKLEIPFSSIDSFEHTQKVAHHLGVLPAVAVGLVKKR